MSIIKRSLLYISRKKRKSLTLFVTLCLVATALISGIAVKKAGRAASQQFAKHSASMLHIASNQKDIIGDGYGSGEIPEKAMQEIAKNPAVKRVNNTLTAYAGLTSQKMVTRSNSNSPVREQLLFTYGNSYSKYDAKFTAGMIALKEGRHIKLTDHHVMMVHEAFAKANHLKVGSKLSFSKDPLRNAADKSLIEATIVGIFKGKTSQKTDNPYEMLENTAFSDESFAKDLYGYKEGQAFYSRSTIYPKKSANLENLQAFIKKQAIPWNKYELAAKDLSLKTYAKSIDVLNQLMDTMQDGVLIVAMVLTSMALLFWIGGRTHETGILLAIGKSKLNIISQYALEVIVIALPAFAFSALTGQWIGQKIGDSLVYQASRSVRADFMQQMGGMNLGADSETDMLMQTIKKISVQVTPAETLSVFAIGLLVILVAVIASSLIIARYKPREILSKLS